MIVSKAWEAQKQNLKEHLYKANASKLKIKPDKDFKKCLEEALSKKKP